MQNSNQPVQQTDKNKGDQSAVEQQQKEQTGKNPSPENMSGSQNAQQNDQADQQVTGQKQHVTNNDGAPVNTSDASQDQTTMGSRNMSNQGQGNKDMSKDKSRQNDQSTDKDQGKDQGR